MASFPCWLARLECPACTRRHLIAWRSVAPPWQQRAPLEFSCPVDGSRVTLVRVDTWFRSPDADADAIEAELWDAMR